MSNLLVQGKHPRHTTFNLYTVTMKMTFQWWESVYQDVNKSDTHYLFLCITIVTMSLMSIALCHVLNQLDICLQLAIAAIPRFIPFEYLQTIHHSLLEYSRIWPIISTSVKSFYYLSLSYYWNTTGWNTRRHLCSIGLWINLLSQCCFREVILSGT